MPTKKQMPCRVCSAMIIDSVTGRKKRCKRRESCRINCRPFCWQHAQTYKRKHGCDVTLRNFQTAVRIKKSKIQGANQGLFAVKDLRKRTKIPYGGTKIGDKQKQILEETGQDTHLIKIGQRTYWDANPQMPYNQIRVLLGGVANEPPPGIEPNAELIEGADRKPWIELLRSVKKNEEIYVCYGPDYFGDNSPAWRRATTCQKGWV